VKSGSRALGVATSDGDTRSTLCGALVRADRVVDGCVFGECTVGGTDSTEATSALFSRLGREDVQYLLLSGVAPAWFNLYDLQRLHEATDRPVLSVSFEASEGLTSALREQFDGDDLERRLAVYESLPPRRRLEVNGESVFVRAVGIDEGAARDVVRAFTPEGGRPEPLRVARLLARAGRELVETAGDDGSPAN
jgi:endonuclease V-like protein UPF0215 family